MTFAGRIAWLAGVASFAHGVVVSLFMRHVGALLGDEPSRGSTEVVVLAYGAVSLLLGVSVYLAVQRPFLALISDLRGLALGERDLREVFKLRPSEVDLAAGVRAAAADVVRKLNRESVQRDNVSAAIAHDLKTPLIAAGRWLRQGLASDDPAVLRQGVGTVAEEIERLVQEVQRLIDVQRFGRQDVYVGRGHVYLHNVVEDVFLAFSRIAKDRSIALSRVGTQDALGDAQAIRRAIENVVGNAIRHAKTRVDVELLPGLVRISDDGPGLPEGVDPAQHMSPLRDDSDWSPSGSGGLGWYVAGSIARAHGGRLAIERTGATGTVVLIYLGKPPGRLPATS